MQTHNTRLYTHTCAHASKHTDTRAQRERERPLTKGVNWIQLIEFLCVLLLFFDFVFHFISDHFTSLRLTSKHFKYTKERTLILFSISDLYMKNVASNMIKSKISFDLKTFALTKCIEFIILLSHYSNSSIKDWPHVHSRHSNH